LGLHLAIHRGQASLLAPESALADHIRPAAKKAGITKHSGWQTFRDSVSTLLDEAGASLKTVQETLRHANSRITADYISTGMRS